MVTASPKWVFPGTSESILWTFTILFAVIWMQKMDVGEGFLLEGWWIKIRDSWGWIHKPLQAQTKPSAICTVIALIKLSFTKSYFNVLSEILNSMLNTIKSKERGPTRASRNKCNLIDSYCITALRSKCNFLEFVKPYWSSQRPEPLFLTKQLQKVFSLK